MRLSAKKRYARLKAEGKENQIRLAAELVDTLLALNPAPLINRREPDQRVISTCRHFAVISCALLRHRGIKSRVRCGFATYFQQGQGLDHWITEYWHQTEHRWVRVDPEILHQPILAHPENLKTGEFLSGAEAWIGFREGHIDAATFGVHGTANWGPAEIRGNAIKDLAALNKVEMLPWHERGRMTASYSGETGPDYDELLDAIAATCTSEDLAAIAELYAHNELRVPPELARREAAAVEQVEQLRRQIGELTGQLQVCEQRLSRLVVTRETLTEIDDEVGQSPEPEAEATLAQPVRSLGRAHRLRIDHRRGRIRIPALAQAHPIPQIVVHGQHIPAGPPAAERGMHGMPRREIHR